MRFWFTRSSSPIDSDALLWRSAVVTAGGTVSDARLAIVSAFIVGLKADGLYPLLDRLWLLAAENTISALIDIKALATATAVAGPTFAVDQGYTGDGIASYLDTGFAPSAGVNFTQNNAHFSAYIRTNRTTFTEFPSPIGTATGVNTRNAVMTLSPPNSSVAALNISNAATTITGIATTAGSNVVSRLTSTPADVAFYKNGIAVPYTETEATVSPSTFSFFVGGINLAGSLALAIDDQVAIVSMGAGLSAAQALSFANRSNAYMTALGTNVY